MIAHIQALSPHHVYGIISRAKLIQPQIILYYRTHILIWCDSMQHQVCIDTTKLCCEPPIERGRYEIMCKCMTYLSVEHVQLESRFFKQAVQTPDHFVVC